MRNVVGILQAALFALRLLMEDPSHVGVEGGIDAYIVPSFDPHLSEYIAPCDERRAFISGFTGSAGTAIVTNTSALLWTDGRYFIQAEKQIDTKFWTLMKQGQTGVLTITNWLKENVRSEGKVGVDPMLYSKSSWDSLENELKTKNISLIPVHKNLIDEVWEERPPCSTNKIFQLDLEFTGKNVSDKLKEVRTGMKTNEAEFLIVSELDQIAWILNLRGSDIPYNPVFFSYLIIHEDYFQLFVNSSKIEENAKEEIAAINGILLPYESIIDHIEEHVGETNGKIQVSSFCNAAIVNSIPSERRLIKITPIALMKAIKNDVEANGLIFSHVKDGAALVEFFSWLEEEMIKGQITITEISASKVLENFRSQQKDYMGLSFEAIAASGPNGAIVHYAPSTGDDRKLALNELFLLDSGGQFKDGTTDVTRTVHFSTPTEQEKEFFTRVLKGQIGIRKSFFPQGSSSQFLDTIARQSLWEVGLEYLHGTGHGIGAFLGVHEDPLGIPSSSAPGLQTNLFISNEPGFYLENEFGIRLENIVRVVEHESKYTNKTFLTFEDVTLVPIQQKMIMTSLLSRFEIEYINEYHEKCRKIIGDHLIATNGSDRAINWLIHETQPIDETMSGNNAPSLNYIKWFFTISILQVFIVT